MPYRVEKKELADLYSERKAIGITIPFTGNTSFNSTYQTIDAYKANLKCFFLTGQEDRYMNPEFGNRFQKYIFEPSLSTFQIEALKGELLQDLAENFPKLVVDVLEVNSNIDGLALQIHLEFHIRNTQLQDELTINYE